MNFYETDVIYPMAWNWSLKQNHEIEGIKNCEITKFEDPLYLVHFLCRKYDVIGNASRNLWYHFFKMTPKYIFYKEVYLTRFAKAFSFWSRLFLAILIVSIYFQWDAETMCQKGMLQHIAKTRFTDSSAIWGQQVWLPYFRRCHNISQ